MQSLELTSYSLFAYAFLVVSYLVARIVLVFGALSEIVLEDVVQLY
jgi:hypothetical protein